MGSRRFGGDQRAAAFAAGLALNGLFVGLLVFGVPRRTDAPAPPDEKVVTLELARASPIPKRDPAKATTARREEAVVARPFPAPSQLPPLQAPATAAPPPAPPVLAARPPAEGNAATGDEALLAAAVLRRMRECSQQGFTRDDQDAKCGRRRVAAQDVDRLPAERRLEFEAVGRRAADLLDTSAALQRTTQAPFAGASAVRFGCVFSGGKRRCGTY